MPSRSGKEPTATSLVLKALRTRDDFMNQSMLREALPGVTMEQISAAVHHLRKYRAADVIIDPNGVGWWYALPEESDTRMRTVGERTPEVHPRRPRKRKVK